MKSLSLHEPHAIVMVGIPGSGKSFFAEKFAQTFSAPYLEAALFRHFAENNDNADKLLQHVLVQLAKTKQSVVLELDTESRTRRTELAKQLRGYGYTPLFVWVQVDERTAATRSKKAYQMSKDEHEDRVKRFSPPHDSERALVISGKHTFASQVRIVLKRLSGPRTQLSTSKPVPERTNHIVLR